MATKTLHDFVADLHGHVDSFANTYQKARTEEPAGHPLQQPLPNWIGQFEAFRQKNGFVTQDPNDPTSTAAKLAAVRKAHDAITALMDSLPEAAMKLIPPDVLEKVRDAAEAVRRDQQAAAQSDSD